MLAKQTRAVLVVGLAVTGLLGGIPLARAHGPVVNTGYLAPQPLSAGVDVKALQVRLSELGYPVGGVDGRYGSRTWQGVCTARWLSGRSLEGAVTQLDADEAINIADSAARRQQLSYIDVSLPCQTLVMVQDGSVVLVTPVSTGNGKFYSTRRGKAIAQTPRGNFKVTRKILGLRKSELGELYNPIYFFKGYAIHGSHSVPSRPASHGCVRVLMRHSAAIHNAAIGTYVYIG
jgi:peptidoglycan hydrolase-like protein with peptidoglycan-binding domain